VCMCGGEGKLKGSREGEGWRKMRNDSLWKKLWREQRTFLSRYKSRYSCGVPKTLIEKTDRS